MQLATLTPQHAALPDAALVNLARAGDEAAVRTLVRRHNRRLFRVARGVLRDDAEAEDVVQETYVRAFTRLDRFRGEAELPTWLTRIALNEALGRLRKRRPGADLSALDAGEERAILFPMSPAPAGPEGEAGRAQARAVLEQAVDALPEAFRLVFVLRDMEGMSIEETAAALSIRPETVKTRLHRARRMLRRSIERMLSAGFADIFPFDGERCVRMADRVVACLQRG
jgi:RNA polymerase sigma-70 factor (ECF subfamily)